MAMVSQQLVAYIQNVGVFDNGVPQAWAPCELPHLQSSHLVDQPPLQLALILKLPVCCNFSKIFVPHTREHLQGIHVHLFIFIISANQNILLPLLL